MSSRRSNFAWFRLGRFFFVHATSLGFFFENDAAVMATSRRHMASVFVRCSPTAEIKYKFRRNRLIRSRPSSPFLCRPFLYFFFLPFKKKKERETAHEIRPILGGQVVSREREREREKNKSVNHPENLDNFRRHLVCRFASRFLRILCAFVLFLRLNI